MCTRTYCRSKLLYLSRFFVIFNLSLLKITWSMVKYTIINKTDIWRTLDNCTQSVLLLAIGNHRPCRVVKYCFHLNFLFTLRVGFFSNYQPARKRIQRPKSGIVVYKTISYSVYCIPVTVIFLRLLLQFSHKRLNFNGYRKANFDYITC